MQTSICLLACALALETHNLPFLEQQTTFCCLLAPCMVQYRMYIQRFLSVPPTSQITNHFDQSDPSTPSIDLGMGRPLLRKHNQPSNLATDESCNVSRHASRSLPIRINAFAAHPNPEPMSPWTCLVLCNMQSGLHCWPGPVPNRAYISRRMK